MSGQRIVLIVLIALAVLYAAGVGLGLRGGVSGGRIGWVEGLSTALTPRLDFEKLTGPCVDRQANSFVIPPESPCEVSIPSFKSGTRKMSLRLTAGTQIKGRYGAPAEHEKIDKNDESANQTVSIQPDKEVSLVILKEGGVLLLTCDNKAKAPCQAAVK